MAFPHKLTDEERSRGGQRSGEVRRERGRSFRERLADKMDERAEALSERLLDAGVEDWRAIIAAAAEAFGKPETVVTGRDGGPVEIVVRSMFDDEAVPETEV